MPALYVLFSNQIQHIACGYSKPKTTEGVFFDSASNLYDHFFGNDPRGPKNTPISCLFSCFSKKCNYFENCKLCKVCKYCDNEDYCLSTKSSDGACSTPFELLLKTVFFPSLDIWVYVEPGSPCFGAFDVPTESP